MKSETRVVKKTAKKAAPKKAPAKRPVAKKTAPKKAAAKKTAVKAAAKKSTGKKVAAKKTAPRKWSKRVTETSDAMDLDRDIFTSKDPKEIAASVKESAEKSKRKKAGPFQSAMSMINFYENRGGKNISAAQKKILDKSKEELRKLFGREES